MRTPNSGLRLKISYAEEHRSAATWKARVPIERLTKVPLPSPEAEVQATGNYQANRSWSLRSGHVDKTNCAWHSSATLSEVYCDFPHL
jgi:hypothetical protein